MECFGRRQYRPQESDPDDATRQSIREGKEPAISLEESIKNMAVGDAIFRSGKSGQWERVVTLAE